MTDTDTPPTDSDLAESIRDFRDELQRMTDRAPDHAPKAVHIADIADDLDTILEEHDATAPDLELVVEFRQRFTVRPPDHIDDPVTAERWFFHTPEHGTDVVNPRNPDHYEVLAVRPRRDD